MSTPPPAQGVTGDAPDGGIAYPDVPVAEARRLHAVRRAIAGRLSYAARTTVPVTLHRLLDAEALVRASADRSVGLFDRLLFAVVSALRLHPAFNATFDGRVHRLYGTVNLGVAVDTPKGVVVPVVRACETLDVGELAAVRKRLVASVRAWAHSPDDLRDGTFSVTNLGMLKVDFFTPVINPPEVAILGVGRLQRQVLAWDAETEPWARWLLPASLTFDHRVTDGADAARFLETIEQQIKALEDPAP